MRNTILGVAIGLVLGAGGAMGYSYLFGAGHAQADLQNELIETKADLDKATRESHEAKAEVAAMSTQVKETKADLAEVRQKLQADVAKAPAVPSMPSPMANAIKASLAQQRKLKLQMLIKRLNLTPEQIEKVTAAMDEQDKVAEEMATKMMSGGKVDPAEMKNVHTVEQTLNDILTPDQKTTYKQVQADEKSNTAESMASMETNQMATSLQLTDAQKDQVYAALYQQQMDNTDPNWIKTHATGTKPADFVDAQAKAADDAMAKILTPDQMATYRQQKQAEIEMQKEMMKNFAPNAQGDAAAGMVIHTNP